MTAPAGVELEMLVSELDALTTLLCKGFEANYYQTVRSYKGLHYKD